MTKLTLFNLSVMLETTNHNLLEHIKRFLKTYYTIRSQGFGQNTIEVSKVFVSKIKDQGVYYFHTRQFVHLYHYLEKIGVKIEIDERVDMRDYEVHQADYQIREGWELRDHQKPVNEFLLKNPVKSKLVPLPPGQGKTFLSLYSISKLNQRLGIIVLSQYVDKWVKDIVTIHKAELTDIMVIQGGKSLRAIIEQAKNNELVHNYYIFSSRTIQIYISSYEDNPELCIEEYGCAPIELFPLLNIGILLIDESHQHYHNVYKILLHTNVKFQIGLSATMISDDDVVSRVHKIVYSDDETYQGSKIERYTDVYAINYSIAPDHMRFIKTKEYGSNNYSHNAFEKSIDRNKLLKENYVRLITSTIDDYYLADYEKDDKLLIFVATVKFATHLTDLLVQRMPEFKVNRYCEDDPYENLMESDVIISTVISSGTAVDIPNLRVAIQTVCISSTPSNIQTLGRLRKLKDRDVKFCYLYSNKLQKHEAYHKKRVELFQNRVANIVYRQCRYSL